jgi:hypothetical protein
MTSIIKVDTIQDQAGNNIINENANTITIGASGDTINIIGTLQNNGGALPGDISSVVAGTGLSGGGTTGAVTLNVEAAQSGITSLGTLTGLTVTGTGVVTNLKSTNNNTVLRLRGSNATNGGALGSSSSGDLTFLQNLAEGMRLTSTGLGIGTSNPTHNLTVDGGTSTSVSLIKDETGSATVRYYNGGSQKAYIQLTATEDMDFYAASGVDQVFYGNNAEVMRLSSGAVFNEVGGDRDFRVESNNNANMLFVDGGTDRVGIGTAAPTYKLTVQASADNQDLIRLNHPSAATAGAMLGFTTDGTTANNVVTLGVQYSNADFDVINIQRSTQNVGINETAPLGKLHVKSADSGASVNTGGDEVVVENSSDAGISILSGTSSKGQLIFGDSGDNNIARLQYTHSDNSMQFFTNAAERMRIDSAGSLGLGTTAPFNSRPGSLTISNEAPTIYMEDTNGSGSKVGQLLYQNAVLTYSIGSRNGTGTSNSTTHLTINDVGNVGIGETTPLGKLHVKTADSGVTPNANADELFVETSGNAGITIGSGTSSAGQLCFGDSGDNDVGAIAYLHDVNAMRFTAGGTERARILSNTFMVGKTSASGATNGVELKTNDESRFTQTARTVIAINRLSSDGSIVDFKKDNTSIGSISAIGGDLTIQSTASGHEGLRFGNGAIVPVNTTGGSTDNECTLGGASGRFANLFLAGGVYLGGTGAANKLDDYEEGDWTAAIGSYGGTPTINNSHYIKIGKLVMASTRIVLDGTSDASQFRITGLPFTCKNTTNDVFGGTINITTSTVARINFLVARNSTEAYFYQNDMGALTYNGFGNDKQIRLTLIYQTT